MATPEANTRVRWDGTINLGTIIALVGVAAPLIIGTVSVVNKIGSIESIVMEQGTRFDSRLKNVEDITNNIRIDLAKNETMRNTVADHESRIRQLETGRGN